MIWTIGPWCCWWHRAVQLLMPPPLPLLFRTDDTDIVIISIVEWRGWWRLFPIKMSPKTAAPSNENEKNALTWQLNAADKFYEWHLLCKYKSGGKWERESIAAALHYFFSPIFPHFSQLLCGAGIHNKFLQYFAGKYEKLLMQFWCQHILCTQWMNGHGWTNREEW